MQGTPWAHGWWTTAAAARCGLFLTITGAETKMMMMMMMMMPELAIYNGRMAHSHCGHYFELLDDIIRTLNGS
jgi:acyl dehydratase